MRCLGTPLLVTSSGEQVRFRTRKHFALLIRLALEPGRRLTRDYLVDLLWPEAPARLASHSLAQALSALRTKVGVGALHIQRAAVALAVEAVDVDAQHLDACDVAIRGPFLDGFEIPAARAFEGWKDECRAKLMAKVRDCLVKQMDAGRRIGDFASVERHAQVLYDLDPLSEDAVRGLMEARAWVGDRSNALKAYARFAERLAEELGAQPSPDLVRMADLLRQGRRSPVRGTAAAVSERAEKRFEAETLVGRATEFAALYDAWLDVRRREPRVVVLTGDPGIGKTTLTNAFASSVQMEGAVVARAQAYDAERELPFAVLGELVRQLTIQRAVGSADPEALGELSRITPDIFALFPGVPKPIEWSAEVTPLRLADAFLKTVTAAAEESPVVLVVDDIHAADNASAGILHMVARKIVRTRVLFILAGRSGELRLATAPGALIADTVIDGLRHVDLEPLSPAASGELIARLTARAAPAAAPPPSERILRASSGNPLAIELLTKEWVDHGPESLLRDLEALDTLPAATVGIPRAIRAVFERQVQRLHRRTRAVLDLAAVLGRRLTDLSLYEAVDSSPGEAAEALAQLREDGLLREVHGDLEFRNELLRAQAYYAVTVKVRQQLHRRVAEYLKDRTEEDRTTQQLEVAWHYLRGHSLKHAAPHALEGAEAAINVGAPLEAERLLQAVLDSHPEELSVVRRGRFLLARALVDQSKAIVARPLLQSLLSDPSVPPRERAEILCMQAAADFLDHSSGNLIYFDSAERALEAAEEAEELELLAKALFYYAQSGAEAGDTDRVATAYQKVCTLVENDAARAVGFLHYTKGYCEFFLYDGTAAAASVHRAAALLAPLKKLPELSRAYNALGVCYQLLCQFDQALEAFDKACSLARRIGDDSRVCLILANACATEVLRGDYERALKLGWESVEIGKRALNSSALLQAYVNLAEAYLLRGSRDEAISCLAEAEQVAATNATWKARVEHLCESASKALVLGNTSLALDLIASAEAECAGRSRGSTEPSLLEKLRIFRAAHVQGSEAALKMAEEAVERFRDRNPLGHLNALAARAWAESLVYGAYRSESLQEIDRLVRQYGAHGRRDLLVAQGFLER